LNGFYTSIYIYIYIYIYILYKKTFNSQTKKISFFVKIERCFSIFFLKKKKKQKQNALFKDNIQFLCFVLYCFITGEYILAPTTTNIYTKNIIFFFFFLKKKKKKKRIQLSLRSTVATCVSKRFSIRYSFFKGVSVVYLFILLKEQKNICVWTLS
jgi:hypothetical protein